MKVTQSPEKNDSARVLAVSALLLQPAQLYKNGLPALVKRRLPGQDESVLGSLMRHLRRVKDEHIF